MIAAFGVGNLIGPVIGSLLSPTAAAYTAGATRLLCVAYVLLLVPESLTLETMVEVSAICSRPSAVTLPPMTAIQIEEREVLALCRCRMSAAYLCHTLNLQMQQPSVHAGAAAERRSAHHHLADEGPAHPVPLAAVLPPHGV